MKSIFQSNSRSKRHRQIQQQEAQREQPFFEQAASYEALEQEADAVAHAVTHRAENTSIPQGRQNTLAVQRSEMPEKEEPVQAMEEKKEEPVQAMEEKKEEPVQAMEEKKEEPVQAMGKEEEEPVQAKKEASAPEIDFHTKLKSSRRQGSSLPDELREKMEKRMGADFSQVRIHTGAEAAQLTKSIHAQAFTSGQDIYFNEGKYSPDSLEGQHLLAHELTHVVQQNQDIARHDLPADGAQSANNHE